MGDFFAELRRRHIYRIGAGYVVVAWGITQVLDVLSQIWALPASIAQPVTIVLALGLPVTLIVVWMIEGKAHEAVASAVRSPATTIDYALFGVLALVLAGIGYQQFAPREPVIALPAEPENLVVAIADEEVEQIAGVLPNSIAVLPFANLSPDPDNAYFAAGIHESTLNQLATVRDFNVIARTSVMQYETDPPPIPEIAEALNVEMVMEGSVRYANDRVLITAQLIDGQSGIHLWADEYDRDLVDIFAVQAEIASNIAMALEAELLPGELESIERAQTDSPDAYAAFLRAMVVADGGFYVVATANTRSIIRTHLDEAIRLDPDFALAHAWKALMYVYSRMFDPVTEENWPAFRSEMERFADSHINIALALDPSMGFAHAVRTQISINNWNGRQAQLEAEQALQLSPNDPIALSVGAQVQMLILDQPEEAVRLIERALALDPNNSEVVQNLQVALLLSERYEESLIVGLRCLALNPSDARCPLQMASAELRVGTEKIGLEALRRAEQLTPDDVPAAVTSILTLAYGLFGQTEDAQRTFEQLEAASARQYVHPGVWSDALKGIGDYDEALRLLNIVAENPELLRGPYAALYAQVNMHHDPILEEPEWLELREKLSPLR
jgi:TolB-like protein/Tfp pilus assembly protein PilF